MVLNFRSDLSEISLRCRRRSSAVQRDKVMQLAQVAPQHAFTFDKMNGETLFTMPKAACLRMWVMNHNVHHRAQLGVYLRLNNIAVPAIYGPSADESGM